MKPAVILLAAGAAVLVYLGMRGTGTVASGVTYTPPPPVPRPWYDQLGGYLAQGVGAAVGTYAALVPKSNQPSPVKSAVMPGTVVYATNGMGTVNSW